ncbi:hypothetical protein GX865_04575 [Candidatus Saccharibacteria bacterium]|nr:hypothetical protein [Candidatus Saccharibacteria bacterium]
MTRKRKNVKHDPSFSPGSKSPKIEASVNPDAFWDESPSWCFKYADRKHDRWRITCDTIDETFIDNLIDRERQKWNQILTSTSGKSKGTRNHQIQTNEICKDAQKRLKELKLDHEDVLYSIRIKSRYRWWGVIRRGVFYFIWSDLNHEICPTADP